MTNALFENIDYQAVATGPMLACRSALLHVLHQNGVGHSLMQRQCCRKVGVGVSKGMAANKQKGMMSSTPAESA